MRLLAGFRFRVERGAAIVTAGESLRNMKPAAAFSIGLWTGAAVIAAVGLFYMQGFQRVRSNASSAANSELAARAEQIRLLEQENARLNAEVQRLKETATTLKSSLAARSTVELRRRVPYIRAPVEPAPTDSVPEKSTQQPVASADATSLAQLEKLAETGNRRALEAVALLADQDRAATLTRVWRSGLLTLPNLVDATRYLAATMEVNPEAEQLLRGLAADQNADPRVLYAAVDGLTNPNFPVNFEGNLALPAPPHFKPDYAERIRMLEGLQPLFTDETLRASVDQARIELQRRWAESNPNPNSP